MRLLQSISFSHLSRYPSQVKRTGSRYAIESMQHLCANLISVYIFDMRKMNRALNVLKDHVAAVMDVEFSPTGEELVVCVISESFISSFDHFYELSSVLLPQMGVLGV